MKCLFVVIIVVFLFACHKSENLVNRPEYKALVAHSWILDSSYSVLNRDTTVVYASASDYRTVSIELLSYVSTTYENGMVTESVKYTSGYEPDRLRFFPYGGGVSFGYADIKVVNDTTLVLENHLLSDSTGVVITDYYRKL